MNIKTILSTIVLGSMLAMTGSANAKDEKSKYDMCLDLSKTSVITFENYTTTVTVDGFTNLIMAVKETSYDSKDKTTGVTVDMIQFDTIVESGTGFTLPDKIGLFRTSVEKNGISAISVISFNGDAFSATQQNIKTTKHTTGRVSEMLVDCPTQIKIGKVK